MGAVPEEGSPPLLAQPQMRQAARVLWDWMGWLLATFAVVGSRYDFQLNGILWANLIRYAIAACLLQCIVGVLLKLYLGGFRNATFEEALCLALVTGIVGSVLAMLFVGLSRPGTFPRAVGVLTPPVALLVMAAGRWAYRAVRERVAPNADAERVLIYGAGDAGYQLLRLIMRDRSSPYQVVGFVDDHKSKRHLRLLGVPVRGRGCDLVKVARQYEATTVILSIAVANSTLVRRVSTALEGSGIRLLVLPPVHELIAGRVTLSDIREVDIADILGRHQIQTDVEEIAGYLTDRVVLVTGAGGSIGSELAKQIYRYGPRELILLDRDESALHGVQLTLYGRALLDTPDMVLADIRDESALEQIFARHKPQVVFHAAALKHLPMLEQYPTEGWKTNVIGTLNLLRSAERHGCSTFVNISTDKAADPTSVLGTTKRLAERLTAWYAGHAAGTYLSVRFGNVLGSRGSMLQTFTQQIDAGGPVTVTHPEITRFFMTIPEACELTIQAAAIGDPGEVLVLDMGQPVRILDIARQLVARSNRHVEIVFTGLRSGEKLHEVRFSADERGVIKRHPLISHVPVPPIDPADAVVGHPGLATSERPMRLVAR